MKAAFLGLLILAATSAASAAEVRIKDYKFVPEKVTVKAGETVKWTNDEKRASHSIWFKAEGLPESERMLNGDSWER
ncbi:MAG TPA: plastocyanin/azurin family copper-binding protein, partial [Burkholderiales bacterium]|nr:plastocyanin/azurin family copper-binding protein [Burkholderiales bacterium]